MSMPMSKDTVRFEAPRPGPGDFYYENGFIVFTREYHLRRGFCCKSGCRHCPWDFTKTAAPSNDENVP